MAVSQLGSPPRCPRRCDGLPRVAVPQPGWVQPPPAVSVGSPAWRWRSWAGSGPPLRLGKPQLCREISPVCTNFSSSLFPNWLGPRPGAPRAPGEPAPSLQGLPAPQPSPGGAQQRPTALGGHAAGPGQPAATGWLQCWDFGRLTCCSRQLPRGLGVDFPPVPMSQGGSSPGCSRCQGAPSLKPSM